MGELKQKQRIREKKLLNREEVCHGTLEDILLGEWWGGKKGGMAGCSMVLLCSEVWVVHVCEVVCVVQSNVSFVIG